MNTPASSLVQAQLETETASPLPRTSALSSRELARPPSVVCARLSKMLSAEVSPGIGHMRKIRVVETWSLMIFSLSAASCGTVISGSTTSSPRGIAPNHLATFSLAVATSMSPASTSTALLGP